MLEPPNVFALAGPVNPPNPANPVSGLGIESRLIPLGRREREFLRSREITPPGPLGPVPNPNTIRELADRGE